jgi:3-hydroxyisobutyrate dehydrogenase-like beta-hydroxyacid dehydrogenase
MPYQESTRLPWEEKGRVAGTSLIGYKRRVSTSSVSDGAAAGDPAHSWLIVGHGSVGSSLTARLVAHGETPLVYDPNPRVPVSAGRRVGSEGNGRGVDYVASCVTPSFALEVPAAVAAFVRPHSVFFDWNTISPEVKQDVASRLPCPVVDVALLDSVDSLAGAPRLAISGPTAQAAQALLANYGFEAEIAGSEIGAAALLKYTRSIFMKSLEALVLEYVALAESLDDDQIVWRSLEQNLGPRFTKFALLLLATNRVHAGRRAAELADAVDLFHDRGRELRIATAAIDVLSRAADGWQQADAPPEDATAANLATYMSRLL